MSFQKAHEACGPLEIDSALKTVQTLKCELQDAKMSVIDAQLKPLPGETVSAPQPILNVLSVSDVALKAACLSPSFHLSLSPPLHLSLSLTPSLSVAGAAGEVRAGFRKHVQGGGLLHGSVADLCGAGQRALHRRGQNAPQRLERAQIRH